MHSGAVIIRDCLSLKPLRLVFPGRERTHNQGQSLAKALTFVIHVNLAVSVFFSDASKPRTFFVMGVESYEPADAEEASQYHFTEVQAKRRKIIHENHKSFQTSISRISASDLAGAKRLNCIAALSQVHHRNFTDALYPDNDQCGRVVAMGSNEGDQAGLTKDDSLSYPPTFIPSTILPSKQIIQVAAGGMHSLALQSNGDVYGWGVNDDSQLGIADCSASVEKAEKIPVSCITQIAAGISHSLFLNNDGAVFSCGTYKHDPLKDWRDVANELEAGSCKGKNKTPVEIKALPKIAKIDAGGKWNAALGWDGILYTWGIGTDGQLARSKSMGAPTVVAEDFSTEKNYESLDYGPFALKAAEIRTEKDGEKPHAFPEKMYHYYLKPNPVDWDPMVKQPRILDFACGELHLLVVAQEAGGQDNYRTRVFSAGIGHGGQLGHGNTNSYHYLKPIAALDDKLIGKVAAGQSHSAALDVFGENVFTWGNALSGKLGISDEEEKTSQNVPHVVSFPEDMDTETRLVGIYCGEEATFACTLQGDVYSWGFNESCQTGHSFQDGDVDAIWRPRKLDLAWCTNIAGYKPVDSTHARVISISSGAQHSLMIAKVYKKN
mmetsp:Transcript_26534/g.49532  ORF Transcript_26534/g.49532 Transcript_26534/m.49532 type:complete len:607 (-) Transcript_26534:1052-2872(-)